MAETSLWHEERGNDCQVWLLHRKWVPAHGEMKDKTKTNKKGRKKKKKERKKERKKKVVPVSCRSRSCSLYVVLCMVTRMVNS